jgi:hypothetical protein
MADPPHVPDHVHGLLDWALDFWSRVKEAFSPRLSEQEAVDHLLCFAIDVGVARHGEDKALEDLYIYNPSLEQRAQDCLVQAAAKKKMPFKFADVTAAILGATQRLEAAKANAAREEEALIRAVQKSRVAHAQVLEIEALLQCDEQGAFVHGVDVHAVEKLCHVMNYTDLVGWGRAARALRDSNGDADAAYRLLVGIAPEPNGRITRGSSSSSGAASSSTDRPRNEGRPRALCRRPERYRTNDERSLGGAGGRTPVEGSDGDKVTQPSTQRVRRTNQPTHSVRANCSGAVDVRKPVQVGKQGTNNIKHRPETSCSLLALFGVELGSGHVYSLHEDSATRCSEDSHTPTALLHAASKAL